MSDGDRIERGQAVRAEVMGAGYGEVEEFMQPLRDMVLEVAWGGVWDRPGLPRATRSLVVVGVLSALGRTNELKGHVRGALNNGCTPEEIREVLLQVGAYAGLPAAVTGHGIAREAIAAWRESGDPQSSSGKEGRE